MIEGESRLPHDPIVGPGQGECVILTDDPEPHRVAGRHDHIATGGRAARDKTGSKQMQV